MVRTGHARYFLQKVKVKGYNIMIDGKNFFDQPVKNDVRENDNIRNTATVQGDDYTAVFCYVTLIPKKII